MKTEEEKQTWVTPEIVNLDVKDTKSNPQVSAEEELFDNAVLS